MKLTDEQLAKYTDIPLEKIKDWKENDKKMYNAIVNYALKEKEYKDRIFNKQKKRS